MKPKYVFLTFLFVCVTVLVYSVHLYLRTRIIGSVATSNGDKFVVLQSWNGGLDGFITNIVHTNSYGHATTYNLDADDDRYHQVPLMVDEENHCVKVSLSGNRVKRVSYR
jgi:hypothetical protein